MDATTVEERLTRVEHDCDELKQAVLGLKPSANAWRQTVGISIIRDEMNNVT